MGGLQPRSLYQAGLSMPCPRFRTRMGRQPISFLTFTSISTATTQVGVIPFSQAHEDSVYAKSSPGTHAECVTNNIDSAFKPLATALRQANRQAMLTETGGGNTQSCVKYVCEQLDYVNQNSDVFLGYTGWSAGAFQPSWNYVLTLVPSRNGNGWSDTLLGSSCFKRT